MNENSDAIHTGEAKHQRASRMSPTLKNISPPSRSRTLEGRSSGYAMRSFCA